MSTAICDFYSDIIFSKKVEPVFHSFYNVEFREGFNMSVHLHERIEIMYVRKGSCHVYAEEKRFRLEPGDFILLNGYVPHRLYVDKSSPCRVLCLEFNFIEGSSGVDWLGQVFEEQDDLRQLIQDKRNIIKLKDTEELYGVLNDIYHELERVETGKSIYIQAGFIQFIIKLARLCAENRNSAINPSERYIKEAIGFMNRKYHEEVSVEQIAEHVNLNVSYFHKIFKQSSGMTPMEYLNKLRINKAKMMLENTDLPIIEICGFVGFNSRQYFSYAFKKQECMTPKEYRRSIEESKSPVSI